jgi:hypothetical protein
MVMAAYSFPAGRRRVSAHDPGDRFLGDDTQSPNYRAHRRWFLVVVIIFALAIAVALVCGALRGLSDVAAAFPALSALLDGRAWGRLLAAFGRIAVLVLAAGLAMMLFRRRRRSSRRK